MVHLYPHTHTVHLHT